MVSMLAFYYDDPSSNPAKVYKFSVKLLLNMNKKRPGLAQLPCDNLASDEGGGDDDTQSLITSATMQFKTLKNRFHLKIDLLGERERERERERQK